MNRNPRGGRDQDSTQLIYGTEGKAGVGKGKRSESETDASLAGFRWGEPFGGVRFGIRQPDQALEAGSTIQLEIACENRGLTPIWLFGFVRNYPRSLRVSPPKADRPYIRVSFGDNNVLHPPEAFTRVPPGEVVRTGLDLSFAFDRRGAGEFEVAFAYEAVRAAGLVRPWSPAAFAEGVGRPEAARTPLTGVAKVRIERARSLRDAGIDEEAERALDALLLAGDPSTVERLRALGPGGTTYAARRVARVIAGGTEAVLGWRALDALELLGPTSLAAVAAARDDLPHAAAALDFARDWLAFRLGEPTPDAHLPFVNALEAIAQQPDRRGNFVLSWSPYDSPVHGAMRMEVFGNGDRIVVVRPRGQAVPSTRRTLIGPGHMQGMLDALRYSGVWLLRPLRAQGLPDEPKPALEIQLALGEQYTRKIALWNGEWRQGPAFRFVDLLDRLAAAVREPTR